MQHTPIPYNTLSSKALSKIYDLFDNEPTTLDLEEKEGLLKLHVSNVGDYVFNKQPPLRQIWISSPVSGPKRFYIGSDNKFYGTKGKEEMFEFIRNEIEEIRKRKGKK